MASIETRSPRSDAARNREQLLAVATRVLASAHTEPSMRAIAKEAGVGIATLYRNFPTRESLVEAVYRDQVIRLTNGAAELLAHETPDVALRRWMDLFGDWIAAKSGMIATLLSMVESGDTTHARTREQLLEAISTILDAGVKAGVLRPDISAEDLSAGLIGIFTVAHQAGPSVNANKLLDILLDGLRPRTGS
ncbi:hypothetical protein AL755_10590 [Arthrobacter sp. ERGS1:01]|nr:hypothetical protein AL755_10590 [Arthrobacter sp. ERGS1:01]